MAWTKGTTVYGKASQTWEPEMTQCWGLTLDSESTIVGECETNCAIDDECDVYQWMADETCFRGKSNDCTGSVTVLEGYRKQVITYEEQLSQCFGLTHDSVIKSEANCRGNCDLDVECEVWQWYRDSSQCYRGKANDCTGSLLATSGGIKIVGVQTTTTQTPLTRRLLQLMTKSLYN